MPNLRRQLERVTRETDILVLFVDRLSGPFIISRHYIAEILLLKAFILLESVVQESASLLIAGATYCDGTTPNLLRGRATNGRAKARYEMQHFNRTSPRERLRWTSATEVGENLKLLVPHNEHFVSTLRAHGKLMSDMRKVRNHIAHRNAETRNKFQHVVLQEYGTKLPSLTPGQLLVSNRFSPPLLKKWCLELQIMIKAALRG